MPKFIERIHDNKPKLTRYKPDNPPDIRNLKFQQTFGKTHVSSGGTQTEEHWSNGYYSVAWFDGDLKTRGYAFIYSNAAPDAFRIKHLFPFTDPDPAVPFTYYDFKNPTYLDVVFRHGKVNERHLPLSCGNIPDDPQMAFDKNTKQVFDKNAYFLFIKTILDIEDLIQGATGGKWFILKTDLRQALEAQLAEFLSQN